MELCLKPPAEPVAVVALSTREPVDHRVRCEVYVQHRFRDADYADYQMNASQQQQGLIVWA